MHGCHAAQALPSSFGSASVFQLWGIVRMLVIIDSYKLIIVINFAAVCWLCSVLSYLVD